MKLRRLLIEISFDQALKVLNIDKNDSSDEAKLKAAFRTAAMKAHPDRGGSNEAMRDVTDAFEILKKNSKSVSDRFDWQKLSKEYLELGLKILEDLKKKFDYLKFSTYFNSIYGEVFTHKIISETPKPNDNNPHYSILKVEFSNGTREIVFIIEISCYLTDAKQASSLGSGVGNLSYPLGVQAFGFYNNKKLKITQRDYNRTNNHDVLTNPEMSFPAVKLEKFKGTSVTKVFKKADMITYLKTKLNLPWDGEWARLKIDKITVAFTRGVFMRLPYWNIYMYEGGKNVRGMETVIFPESIETAKTFEKIVYALRKMDDPEEIKRFISTQLKQAKENKSNGS